MGDLMGVCRFTHEIATAGGDLQKISVGTQPGQANVSQQRKLRAGEPLEVKLQKSLFSLDKKQALYLHINNWKQASLNIYLKLERIK